MDHNSRSTNLIILLFIYSFFNSPMLNGQPKSKHVFDAGDFIINKFDQVDLVAIGETHDKVEVTDFYIRLIQDEEFRKKVDYLVIEMGNHLFQPVLDRYIMGESIDQSELYKLWRDHTSCMLNDSDNTGMIRLLSAVREVNLSSTHKIGVLAGDPAINWQEIDCLQQFYKYLGSRDDFYAETVEKLVLAKDKKALLIMGNSHFNRQKSNYMIEKNLDNPITALSKSSEIFLINIISSSSFPYDKLNNIEQGHLISTEDTWLGQLILGSPFIKSIPLADQSDAILYLGNKNDLTKEAKTAFQDNPYEQELKRRNGLEKCGD